MFKKILIVEDDKDIIRLLDIIFADLVDYETLYALNGQEAVNSTRTNNPDVILLDIHLPDITGYEVCRLVKSDPATSNTKVVIVTGMTQNSDYLKAKEAGADDYIAKPFSPDTLLHTLEGLLGRN